jgi:Tfp pilus assembly protein PilN
MYDALYAQIQTQKTQKATLQSTLESFNQTKNPAELLKHIKATLKNAAQLELLSLNEKQLEIKIIAENTTSLMATTQGLAQHKLCHDLCITSLEHSDKNCMMAVLRTQKMVS